MNRILLATLFALAPLAAAAAPMAPDVPEETGGAHTGRVRVTPVMCVRAPCPPIVEVVDEQGNAVTIRGPLLRDVESLRGKEITVKGKVSGGAMDVTAVAPGRSKSFVTGVVNDTTVCDRMIPPDCRYSVEIHTADGSVIQVTDEAWAKNLAAFDGATVSIKGTVTNTPCPPGSICIQVYQPTLWPDAYANVWVRGRLEKNLSPGASLPEPGVEVATYLLGFPNGASAGVFTRKNWTALVDREAWFSGRFDGESFRATKSGHAIIPDPVIEPIFPWTNGGVTGGGANVPRDGETDVVAGGPAQTGPAQGAGIARD